MYLAKQHAGNPDDGQLLPLGLVAQLSLSAMPAQQAKLGKSLYCVLAHCILLVRVKISQSAAVAFILAASWSAAASTPGIVSYSAMKGLTHLRISYAIYSQQTLQSFWVVSFGGQAFGDSQINRGPLLNH